MKAMTAGIWMFVGMMVGIVVDHVFVGMVLGLCVGGALGKLSSGGAWDDEFNDDEFTDDVYDAQDEHDSAPAEPRGAPGEFYVEPDCCTLCVVPWHIAPELFAYDDRGCWVARQPLTAAERGKMLEVIEIQELGCVRSRVESQRPE